MRFINRFLTKYYLQSKSKLFFYSFVVMPYCLHIQKNVPILTC